MLTFTICLLVSSFFDATFAGLTEEEFVEIIQSLKAEGKELKEKLVSLDNKIQSQNEYIREQDMRIEKLENIIRSQRSVFSPQRGGGKQDSYDESMEQMMNAKIKSRNKRTQNSKPEFTNNIEANDGEPVMFVETQKSVNEMNFTKRRRGIERRVPRSLTYYTPVAFQAYLSHDMYHVTKHQAIVFDTIVTNIGGGYHSHHGLFTAPKAGVYIFSSSLLVQPNSGIEAHKMKNGQTIQGVLANSRIHKDYVQGSGTAVVQLSIGDDVWVETTEWTTSDAALRMAEYTSFMGCLIFEI